MGCAPDHSRGMKLRAAVEYLLRGTTGNCSLAKATPASRVAAVRAYKRTSAPRVASISAMRRPSVPAPRMAMARVAMFSGSLNVMAMPRGFGRGFLPQVLNLLRFHTQQEVEDSISALSVVWTIIGAIAR